MNKVVEKYTTNLTERIRNNLDDYKVIGRDAETRKLIESLLRRTKNSPVLVGEPGVGKTAIVEGFILRQLEGKLPNRFDGVQVVQLSISSLQGPDFMKNFEGLLHELTDNRDKYILFIDEMHMIMGAGQSKGTMDMGNLLKPSLARGNFMVIGATTSDEYQTFIESDGALERRFQKIMVNEPSVKDAQTIMLGLKPSIERFHGITIEDAAINAAISLSKRYITEHYLPDKAIDLIDAAASRVVLDGKHQLKVADVDKQIEEITGIPTAALNKSNAVRALELPKVLNKRVLGQPRAINTVTAMVNSVLVNHNKAGQPLGSFFFLGPSGTGKTELVKSLAAVLFDDEQNLLRFDMSEYKEKNATTKFIQRATSGIRKQPYTILLLDEIEKANPNVFDLLLQILQDGILTDERGRTADFSNAYVVMTSNSGYKFIDDRMQYEGLPEGDYTVKDATFVKGVKKELLNKFRPEFINRIDEIVVFNQLTPAYLQDITRLRLNEYVKTVKQANNWQISFNDEVVEYIADTAYEPEYGARPIVRTIRDKVDKVVSQVILRKELEEPGTKYHLNLSIKKNEELHLSENSRYDDRMINFSLSKML